MRQDFKKPFRQEIVENFISGLKDGTSLACPFEAGEIISPVNGASGKAYSGVNRLILSRRGGLDPRWLTKRQADELGYQSKESAQARRLVFWEYSKEAPALNPDGSPRLNNVGNQIMETVKRDRPAMRYYAVYQAADLLTHDGRELPPYEPPAASQDPLDRASAILANSGASIRHQPSLNAANYKMSADLIILPEPGLMSEMDYYSQAIEELVSWTGHPDRLGWLADQKTESQQIQGGIQETLAKAMVAQDLGLKISQPLVNSLTVKTWENALAKDPDMLFRAAMQADNIRLYVMSQEQRQEQGLAEKESRPLREAYHSQAFRPAGPDDPEQSGPWIPTADEQEAVVFAVVSGKDQSVISTFDNREASVSEADRLNLGAKPTLKYSGAAIALDVPFEEKDMVKALGATWNREISAWCARPGVELNKLGRWIPAQELNRPGLIETGINDRLALDVPYKRRQEAKDLGAFFDNQKWAWVSSVNNKNLDELTKKFPPVPDLYAFPDPAADMAAVPEIASERVVLEVPFEEKHLAKAAGAKWNREEKVWAAEAGTDLSKLSRWIPEKEPEPEKVLAAAQEFAKVLKEAGFQMDELPNMDGKIYRVPIQEGKPGAKDGAYYASMNAEQPNGWLKNHKTGEYRAWIYSGQELTATGKEDQKARAAEKRQAREGKAEKLSMAKWASGLDVATEFAGQIDGLVPTCELLKNPYLEVAGVNAVGGVRRDDDGNLMVPGVNIEGRLQTIQTIAPNGEMHFEKGGNRAGAMCVIDGFDVISKTDLQTGLPVFRPEYTDHGDESLNRDLLIAEDFATGASLHMATGLPVVVAFSLDNLSKVAGAVRDKYPQANILVCANDHPERASNLCLKKAEEAAKKVGGKLVVPEFSDLEKKAGLATFNDLHKTCGLETVTRAINQARQQGQSQNAGLSR